MHVWIQWGWWFQIIRWRPRVTCTEKNTDVSYNDDWWSSLNWKKHMKKAMPKQCSNRLQWFTTFCPAVHTPSKQMGSNLGSPQWHVGLYIQWVWPQLHSSHLGPRCNPRNQSDIHRPGRSPECCRPQLGTLGTWQVTQTWGWMGEGSRHMPKLPIQCFLWIFWGGLKSLNHTKSQNDPTAVEPSCIAVLQKLSAFTICQRDFMCATPWELQHGPEAPAWGAPSMVFR